MARATPPTAAPTPSLTDLAGRLTALPSWEPLRTALSAGQAGGIDGAWGSSAALAVAALASEAPASVLLVVPNFTDVGPWAEDLATFGQRPAVFPAFETWPPVEKKGKLAPETGQRLRVLQALGGAEPPKVVLAPFAAVLQSVPLRDDLAKRGRRIKVGETVSPDELGEWLLAAGYQRADSVEYPGEYGRRGGILDLYPPDATDPVRLEFFGDELESIRLFAAQTQRSLDRKTELLILGALDPHAGRGGLGFLLDYFPAGSVVALFEPGDLKEQGKHFFERVANPVGLFTVDGAFGQLMQRPTVTLSAMPRASVEATAHLRVESIERFSGNVLKVREELDLIAGAQTSPPNPLSEAERGNRNRGKPGLADIDVRKGGRHPLSASERGPGGEVSGYGTRVWIACQTESEIHRLTDVLKTGQLAESGRVTLVAGHVRAGFRIVDLGVLVLGSHELFHKELLPPGAKQTGKAGGRKIESRAIDSFLDLNDGDYVVHVAHGIARFRGMRTLEKGMGQDPGVGLFGDSRPSTANAGLEEFLILEFRDGVLLYVPATRIDLIQRYVGGSQGEPKLSKLGGTSWGRQKDKISEAVMDMAAEMIQIQAVRNAIPGHAFPADSDWQREFEGAFPYQETPDQITAIAEIRTDLEKPKPMDRLLCGDVGYGKTEVAIRAAFKVIDNGKQVAILVPTTVLAEQHYKTIQQRLAEYPFRVECLNRFRSAKEQRETIKGLKDGSIDIVVGTHRLVSEAVKFKDLGLVVIDEEQRFGVEHKEKLKRLRTTVDILTMTATPIPRTLHGALLGVREISNLETPPPDRYPVETRIVSWDDQLIRHAINREFNRGGQVFFVHNRVHDILDVEAKLRHILPDAKIVVGHGQMAEGELEKAMVKFIRKDADILVATTIIESGLDIPNANTIFIDDADQYGLADLHQLRGRVGRTKLRAYAYLIVNPVKLVSPTAQKRLKAIEEFSELGSGFKIAMRDLEIRGAGNILGMEQSGHIATVGYELYCQLLENAVRQLKHQPAKQAVEVNVDLPWPAYLPRDYVPGQKLRIEVYRRLARLRDPGKLADFRQELQDRYGATPEPVEWLLRTTEVRLLCVKWQIAGVHRDGKDLVFSYRNAKKAAQLNAASAGRLKVVDGHSMYLRLQPDEDSPAPMYELLKRLLG